MNEIERSPERIIEYLRCNSGINTEQIAEIVGSTKSTIEKWKNGVVPESIAINWKLVDLLCREIELNQSREKYKNKVRGESNDY